MKKLNEKISLIFAVLVVLFVGLAVTGCPIDALDHQEYVIFRGGKNFMADFFNIERFLVDGDPYFNALNGSYLPLGYLILWPFSRLCDYGHMSLTDCWHSPIAIFSAMLFLLISLFFFFDSLSRLNSKKEWHRYHTFLLLFTSAFLFSIERGNLVFLSLAGVNYFLAYYDSKTVWKRRLALFGLCFASVLKIYPVFFGILLLQDKRYKDIAFCVGIGLVLTFLPFLFFEHGMSNVTRMYANIHTYTALYETPSTEYKFGIHALCNSITWAANYTQPDRLAKHVASNIELTAQIITALLTFVSFVFAYFEKRRWLQAGLIALVIMYYPSHSIFYCALYLMPMIILFLGKKECEKIDYWIAGLICLIMNPIQIVFEPITLTPIIANISGIILWIVLIVHSGTEVWKKIPLLKKRINK